MGKSRSYLGKNKWLLTILGIGRKGPMMCKIVLKINNYLGYEFNTVELAIRNGIPYAIDFCNPAPDADLKSVGAENFEWVVETAANYAIELAQKINTKVDNLSWGDYIKTSTEGKPLI